MDAEFITFPRARGLGMRCPPTDAANRSFGQPELAMGEVSGED